MDKLAVKMIGPLMLRTRENKKGFKLNMNDISYVLFQLRDLDVQNH